MLVSPSHSGEESLPKLGVDGVRFDGLAHLQGAAVEV